MRPAAIVDLTRRDVNETPAAAPLDRGAGGGPMDVDQEVEGNGNGHVAGRTEANRPGAEETNAEAAG